MKNTQTSVSDVETQMEWRLRAAACTETEGNPFKLDDTVLDKTLKSAPPLHETAIWKKVIPDNVWTMIAGEFCSITSSGRRYCSINGRLQGLPSAEKHFENVTICEIIYFIGSLCMTNRDMHLRDDFGIAVSLQSIVGGNGKSCCVKYVTVNKYKNISNFSFF